jgi:ferredoxin
MIGTGEHKRCESGVPMQAFVDSTKCQGHLRCAQYAPTIFEIDEFGHAFVSLSIVPPELEEATRRASENCPERAITIS